MRRVLSMLVALCMILSALMLAPSSAGAETYESGGFKYELLDDGTARITNYAVPMTTQVTDLSIPSTIDGCTVTQIGSQAFANRRALEFVAIPDTVTAIGERAFFYCSKLETIIIPDSVASIGTEAFGKTPWLSHQPEGLVYAGKVAYQYNGECPASVVIAPGTRAIAGEAFYNCAGLERITLPDSLSEIGAEAFHHCENLVSVDIPDSVRTIGTDAFADCGSLEHISTGNGITSLDAFRFSGNKSLKSIVIGDSVTRIDSSKFANCENLESVVIGSSVERIGTEAFKWCEKLNSITFSDSVKSIGQSAFTGTSWLENHPVGYIYAGKVAYGYYRDENGDYPDSIILKDGTIGIADYAFRYMYITSLSMPDTVTHIGEYAFQSCSSLKSIRFSESIQTIGSCAFDATEWWNNQLDGVTYIGKVAYGIKGTYPDDLVLSAGTIGMADSAFRGATFKSITIPDSVTKVSYQAFNGCWDLETVYLPRTITDIESDAFFGCGNLKDIYYAGSEEEWKQIHIHSYPLVMKNAIKAHRDYTIHYGETAPQKENYPIVIVPGVMGSRLFMKEHEFTEDTVVWDPNTSGILTTVGSLLLLNYMLGGDNAMNDMAEKAKQLAEVMGGDVDLPDQLYIRPCENQNIDPAKIDQDNSVYAYGREYGATNAYETLVDWLCDAFSYRNPDSYRPVYFFSYDWRNSNAQSADDLASAVNRILQDTGYDKVDLVCHSMGGLVASRYYSVYSEKRINKIITLGTPYEGAPKLINSVQNWDILGEGIAVNRLNTYKDLALGALGGLTKEVKSSFQGIAELTPTTRYVSNIQMNKTRWAPFCIGETSREITTKEYQKICKSIFGEENYTAAAEFQDEIRSKDNDLNYLYDFENAYFVIGINQPTISSIKFTYIDNDVAERLYEYDVDYDVCGDGTVPYLSSTMLENIPKLPKNRWRQFNTSHGDIVKYTKALKWVMNTLNDSDSDVADDQIIPVKYTKIRIACPVDVTVSKGGETLSSNPETLSVSTSFGRLDIAGENDEIKVLCLKTDPDYEVVLTGTGEGTMDCEITYYDNDGSVIDTATYADVPITLTTVIRTDTDPDGAKELRIDRDGDGQTDAVLHPGDSIEPGDDRPGDDQPGDDQPGDDQPGDDQPGEDQPGGNTDVLRGDVNGDGVVNNRDAVILDRCIAGWDGYDRFIKNPVAADLNDDGKMNNRDAVILDRCIAGWSGYERYVSAA